MGPIARTHTPWRARLSLFVGAWMAMACTACGPDPSTGADASSPSPDAVEVFEDAGLTDATDPPFDWDAAFAHVFDESLVRPIALTFAPGDWAGMLDDWRTLRQRTWRKATVVFGPDTLADVGVRLRGYGALSQVEDRELPAKFPLKLDFDRYGGPRYHGVDRVNLATNRDDFSLMRDRLTARLLLALGVQAPRTAYAKVHVEGVYVGVYTLEQQIDKRFLKERFGTVAGADDGNLYKCIPSVGVENVCNMKWRGNDKAAYRVTGECPDGYDVCGLVQETNEDDEGSNSYADLIAFFALLDQTSDAEFATVIAQRFEVDAFLRFMAVNVCLANGDSLAYGKPNNYYLYLRPDTGRWTLLPYDFDQSYGGPDPEGKAGSPLPTQDAFANNALSRRIMAVPAFLAQYEQYVHQVATVWMEAGQQAAWIGEFDALLAPEIPTDPNIPLKAYQTAIGPTPSGLVGFAAARRAIILGGK